MEEDKFLEVLTKEVIEFCKDKNILDRFDEFLEIAKDDIRIMGEYYNTPCEDCWNGCGDVGGRLWYCKNNT